MKRCTRGIFALAVVGVVAGMSGEGWAASSAILNTLDGGVGSISQGNATYSNFTYASSTVLDSTVVATATTDGSGNSVITFTRTSGTWTNLEDHSVITFHAAFLVPMVSTQLDFVATANGLAIPSVGESFNDGGPQNLQVVIPIGGPAQLTDSYGFISPVTSFDTLKSIDIAASTGTATITSVDNVYVPGAGGGVPEPASLGVLGLGVIGLVMRRRAVR